MYIFHKNIFSFNKRHESRPGTRFSKVPVIFHGPKSKSGYPSLQTSLFCLVNGSLNHVIFKSFEKSILNVNNSFPGLLIAGTFEKQVPVLLQAAYIWISSVLLFIPIQYNCRIECEFIRLCFFLRYCC